jgi:hypothetical protein
LLLLASVVDEALPPPPQADNSIARTNGIATVAFAMRSLRPTVRTGGG